MKIKDHARAQGWYRRNAAAPNSHGVWKSFVQDVKDTEQDILMASAETDRIIQTINDKFGPGTLFPASQAPIPPMTDTQAIMEWEERNRKAGGGRIPFGKGGDVEGLKVYLENLPDGSEVNVKELAKKFKVSRSTVSNHRTILRPELKVAFNLPETKGTGTLTEGILKAYEDLGKGKNTTSVDIYNEIKDLDAFKDYSRRDLLNTIGKRLRTNNKPYTKTTAATEGDTGYQTTKKEKRKIYLDKAVDQPTIVYKATKPGGPSEIINIKFPETGNMTKANFKKAIDKYYSIPKDDAKIKVAKNKIIKDFFPDGLGQNQWNKLVGFFNKQEDIDTKRPYLYGDEGGSQKVSREDRLSKKEEFSDKIFEDRISDEKRALIKEKGLLKNPNFKAGYEPIDLAHRLSLGTSKRFGIQQKTGTIGLDRPVVNQVFMEYYQSKLNKVYNLQRDLITNKPKDWRKKLETGNKLITSIVNDADNRLVGVMIDEKTLKPILFGDKLAAKYAIDQGLFDTEIKNLSSKDKEFIKKFLLEPQIMREVDTGLDVKNFRNINKDSITKWMNKTGRINTELKNQTLKILKDNPQITKSQGALGTKDSQPQVKKIINELGNFKNPKLNKFIAQSMLASGPAGAYELLMKDPITRALINSKPFKEFEALTRGTMRTAGKAFGLGDLVLGYYDYKNNLSKGESPNVARKNAYQMMTFGLWKTGDKEVQKEIRERAVKEGMNPDIFDQTVALNKKHQEFQKTLNEFAEQSEWAGDKAAKSTFEGMLTNNMNDIINMQKKLSVDYGIDQAGGPITIGTSQATEDVKKAAYGYAKDRTASVIEEAALRRDPGAGVEGDPIMNMLGPGWWKKFLPQNLLWGNFAGVPVTEREKEDYRIKQLAKEDPEAFEKYLQEQGVYRSEGMNLPALINFSMRYPEYGVSFETEKKPYFDGGIASLRRKKW